MRKIVLTSTYKVEHESEIVNRLFADGLDELHIVKNQFEKSDMFNYLRKVNKEHHSKIVVHSCYEMVYRFPLRGIHIKEEQSRSLFFKWFTLNPIKKRATGNVIYTTFSSLRELRQRNEVIDEVLLGPIFPHFTEDGGHNRFSPSKIRESMSHCKFKVHAYGGVSIEKMPIIQSLNFAGYVLQGAIWRSPDPIGSFQDFIKSEKASSI